MSTSPTRGESTPGQNTVGFLVFPSEEALHPFATEIPSTLGHDRYLEVVRRSRRWAREVFGRVLHLKRGNQPQFNMYVGPVGQVFGEGVRTVVDELLKTHQALKDAAAGEISRYAEQAKSQRLSDKDVEAMMSAVQRLIRESRTVVFSNLSSESVRRLHDAARADFQRLFPLASEEGMEVPQVTFEDRA